MASKVDAPIKSTKDTGEQDLQILHPERTITIGGDSVTVREYGFIEGMELLPILQPFIDDLFQLVKSPEAPALHHIDSLMGQHMPAMIHAMAIAADRDEQWVSSLSMTDGQQLASIWWAVNGPFVWRMVNARIGFELEKAKKAGSQASPAADGQTPMQPSLPQDTATPSASDN